MEKFLHRVSMQRVLHRGSIEDCADPLLGINHRNDSYAVVAWRTSYTMEAKNIVLIRCWVSSTVIDSYAVVTGRSSYTVEVWKGPNVVEV